MTGCAPLSRGTAVLILFSLENEIMFNQSFKRFLPTRQLAAVLGGTLLMLVGLVTAVHAHGRVIIGPYAVVVGWVDEPPIVGQRNALLLEFTRDETGEPVVNLSSSLAIEILYGDRTYRTNLSPTHTPGVYTAELLPTVQGQYTIHLSGQIGETAVDELIQAEDVISAAQLQFPEVVSTPGDMQAEINALKSALLVTKILAGIGVVAGLAGAALAAVLYRRQA